MDRRRISEEKQSSDLKIEAGRADASGTNPLRNETFASNIGKGLRAIYMDVVRSYFPKQLISVLYKLHGHSAAEIQSSDPKEVLSPANNDLPWAGDTAAARWPALEAPITSYVLVIGRSIDASGKSLLAGLRTPLTA